MSDWLEAKEYSKCSTCPLGKKNSKLKILSPEIIGNYNCEILIVLPFHDTKERRATFEKLLKRKNVLNYSITFGLECNINGIDLDASQNKIYKYCNTIDLTKFKKLKTIITSGSAIFAITKNSDLPSWQEFCEFKFNQTYFLTRFDEKKYRVYPIPSIIELLDTDSFEYWFAEHQLVKVNNYMDDYKPELMQRHKKVFVENPNEFLLKHMEAKEMAWDTETNSLQQFIKDFKCICVTLTFDGITGYYLPFHLIDVKIFSEFLKNKYQILSFGKYDWKVVERFGIENVKVDEDIPLLFHTLNTDRMLNGQKSIAWLLGWGGYEDVLNEYKRKNKIKDYSDIPYKILFPYAVIDPIVAFQAYKFAQKELIPKQPKVYEMYKEILISVIPVFKEMETNGLEINKEKLGILDKSLLKKSNKYKNEICNIIGKKFNVNSNEKLAVELEKLGLPDLGRTKKGFYKTGDEILQVWKKAGFEIAITLLDFRANEKLRNSFVGTVEDDKVESNIDYFGFQDSNDESNGKVEGLAKFICPDGKIHTSYSVAMQYTLRSGASNPGLTQMPKQGDIGKLFRPVFNCPEDYYFWEVDMDGFQMRLMAHYSEDPVMMDVAINKGGDYHSMTGLAFTPDLTLDEFLKELDLGNLKLKDYRQKAKGINFGLIFMGSYWLLKPDIDLYWKPEDKHDYIKRHDPEVKYVKDENKEDVFDMGLTIAYDLYIKFFDKYKMIVPFVEKEQAFAKKNGYIDGEFNSRRHLPWFSYNIKKPTKQQLKKVKHMESVCSNTRIQTAEALIMYQSMIKLNKAIKLEKLNAWLTIFTHDSCGGLVHKIHVRKLYNLLQTHMPRLNEFNVPLTSGMTISEVLGFGAEINTEEKLNNWLEKEGIINDQS